MLKQFWDLEQITKLFGTFGWVYNWGAETELFLLAIVV